MARKSRSFSAETKLAVVKRMLCGEEVRALAKELKVSRTLAMATAPVLATEVLYSCSGGTRVIATFSPPGATPGSVVLVFVGSDARLTLPQVMSADGGRYASNEVEFWIKGLDATLTRSGRSEKCQSK